MLWYKSWLETRFRVLLVFALSLFLIGFIERNTNTHSPSHQTVEYFINTMTLCLSMFTAMLAGTGIKTRPLLKSNRGLYGSMYFTLSLPVSRFRLLATRAGLGMLELVGIAAALSCAAWFIFPALKVHLAVSVLFAYWITVSVCVSAFYFLSVLLTTVLDDDWPIYGTLIAIWILRWISAAFSVPPSVNIFRAMGAASPLFTHTFPWASMGVSLGAAAILFLAALKVVQTREY